MSNAVSEGNPDNTGISNTETESNDDNMRTVKEEVIVPEIIDKAVEEVNKNELLVPVVADSDIASTKKKKSTLSKVGKSLASIIASI